MAPCFDIQKNICLVSITSIKKGTLRGNLHLAFPQASVGEYHFAGPGYAQLDFIRTRPRTQPLLVTCINEPPFSPIPSALCMHPKRKQNHIAAFNDASALPAGLFASVCVFVMGATVQQSSAAYQRSWRRRNWRNHNQVECISTPYRKSVCKLDVSANPLL
jgi:hypothetical protein